MTDQRVTHLYELMDSAYDAPIIRAQSAEHRHVAIIDHNSRGGEKIEFAPHEAERFKERTTVERANARLKDEFGGRFIRVRGHAKVMAHLMFGILTLPQISCCDLSTSASPRPSVTAYRTRRGPPNPWKRQQTARSTLP